MLRCVVEFLSCADQAHVACVNNLYRTTVYSMPKAQLAYALINKEADSRFLVRLNKRELKKYINIRKPIKKEKFRRTWFMIASRSSMRSFKEEDPGAVPQAEVERRLQEYYNSRLDQIKKVHPKTNTDDFGSDDDEVDNEDALLRDMENDRADYCNAREARVARIKARVQFGRTNGIARMYWKSERGKLLEQQYGDWFRLVRQLKIIACRRMLRPYHFDEYTDELPNTVVYTRNQWEACPAASLKTCVFRAFAKHSPNGKCTEDILCSVESDIQAIHQRRVQDHTMLTEIIEACHTFFLKTWEVSTNTQIIYVSNMLVRIRAACTNIKHYVDNNEWRLNKDICAAFYEFFQLESECKHAFISAENNIYPVHVCRRYKHENPALLPLALRLGELRTVSDSNRQEVLSLAPKVNDAYMTALYRAWPLEHMRTTANDGSVIIRISTIAKILMGNMEAELRKDDRQKLGRHVRRYVSANSIHDANELVQLTAADEKGVLYTYSAYGYREHHIPMLAKACLPYVLGL